MLHRPFRAIFVLALFLGGSLASGQELSCTDSPFGPAITLQSDREVMLGIVGRQTAGVGESFRYSEDGQVVVANSSPLFTGLTEWKSVAIDLNGNGKQETAYAGVNGLGHAVIAIVDENANLIDTWTATVQRNNIQIAAVDYYDGQDRRQELFVAVQQGTSTVRVWGFKGDSNGGLQAADGEVDERFTRNFPDLEAFALTSGDFLLDGRDQVALIAIGEPSGNQTVYFDLMFRDAQDEQRVFRLEAAPQNISNGDIADLQATAGYFGAGSGKQLAVAIQYETDTDDRPMELWVSDFEAERNQSDQITGASRMTVSQMNTASGALPTVARSGLYDLAVGDIVRDGVDELLLAFPDSSGELMAVRTYKYRQGNNPNDRFPLYTEHSYTLPTGQLAEDIVDVSIAAADLNGNGFAEAVTAIVDGFQYYLREWQYEVPIADTMGAGCASNHVIGDAACPGTEFIPFPDELETGGVPAQGDSLADFRRQPATGTWELCVAESAGYDDGELEAWTLRVNEELVASSESEAVQIVSGSGSLDACQIIEFSAPISTLVESLSVDVAISYPWVGDLSIELKSPLGSRLTLMNRPGRTDTDYGHAAALSASTPITFTRYAPARVQIFPYASPSSSGNITAATVALPDVDGSSVVALRSTNDGLCDNVSEFLVQNIVYMPPVFPAIQDRNRLRAQVGEALTSGEREGTEFERRAGNSISGYVGASLGGSFMGVTAKASAKATAGQSYESVRRQSESTSSSLTISQSGEVDGASDGGRPVGGLVIRQERNHGCYQYPVFRDGDLIDDSFMRVCELTGIDESGATVFAWNNDIPTPESGPTRAEWTPLVREWASLALGASTSSWGGATSSSNAVNGLIVSGTPFRIDNPQENAHILVDLGEVREITSIRLHVPTDRTSDLRFLRLYAYETERSGFNVPIGSDVAVYNMTTGGGVLDIVNISTVTRLADGSRVPKSARYILIRSPKSFGFARFALDEIQVFGPDEMTPDRHPVAVCDPQWGSGWFRAKTFVRGLINDYVWVDMMGDLDWRSTLPSGATGLDCIDGQTNSLRVRELAVFEGVSLNGAQSRSWEISNDLSGALTHSNSISHSSRYGAEFDAEAGVVATIMVGGGFEINSGITHAQSSEVFWSNSINMGGTVPGIPNTDIASGCNYMPRPFVYRGRVQSNTGYAHRPLIVDYAVELKSGSWTHEGGVPVQCLTSTPVQLAVESSGASGVPIEVSPAPEVYSGHTNYVIKDIVPSSLLQLTAIANFGDTEFVGWIGCDSVGGGADRVCSVQVDNNRTVTAEYAPSEAGEIIFQDRFETDP